MKSLRPATSDVGAGSGTTGSREPVTTDGLNRRLAQWAAVDDQVC